MWHMGGFSETSHFQKFRLHFEFFREIEVLCYDHNMFSFEALLAIYLMINRRMPKCNSVLQSEKDLFQPEIRPSLSENCHFMTFYQTKTFGHLPVKSSSELCIYTPTDG